jgi:hypothetical protein
MGGQGGGTGDPPWRTESWKRSSDGQTGELTLMQLAIDDSRGRRDAEENLVSSQTGRYRLQRGTPVARASGPVACQ